MAYHNMGIEGRRRQVASFLLERLTEREIASRLGVHKNTILKDVAAIRAEWQAARMTSADTWIGEELARLEELERSQWSRIHDLKYGGFAVDRILAIMERRAKYLGLDTQVAADGPQMQVVVLSGSSDGGEAAPHSLAAAWRSRGALSAG